MPELPEVETVVRELNLQLPSPDQLVEVELLRKDLRNLFPKKKIESFKGEGLQTITRRSKYLLFSFGPRGGLLSHLGMTGHWRVEKEPITQRLHDHIRLRFSSKKVLIYNDPRRFGFFDAYENIKTHKLLKDIGPEPFSDDFNADYLKSALKTRKGPIKTILMNQALVAGIGNIYASEILFRSFIKPTRSAGKITREECARIVQQTREVLAEAIRFGGSSFDDFKHVSGEKGGFQDRFQVYDRAGEPCVSCGKNVSKKVQAGRSTYWCSFCQK